MLVGRGLTRRLALGRSIIRGGAAPRCTSLSLSSAGGEHLGSSLEALTPSQVRQIGERSREEWARHTNLNVDFPDSSLPAGEVGTANGGVVDPLSVRRKRLIYRSKQRGWLEVDLLLGAWATDNVPNLTEDELNQYEAIVNCETIDIFHFISKAKPPPPHVNNEIMLRLQSFALGSPLGKASPTDYAFAKRRGNLT